MQSFYIFLIIFLSLYGAVRLMCLFYNTVVDKISGFIKPHAQYKNEKKEMDT